MDLSVKHKTIKLLGGKKKAKDFWDLKLGKDMHKHFTE